MEDSTVSQETSSESIGYYKYSIAEGSNMLHLGRLNESAVHRMHPADILFARYMTECQEMSMQKYLDMYLH